ncbi:hypothetical protein FRC01_001698 [Tulasnella sp. 417]|nr:hypothetical protein FRC01_001698 [Tulasnella sp. 417]
MKGPGQGVSRNKRPTDRLLRVPPPPRPRLASPLSESDSQMLNEHAIMSANGVVTIPKSLAAEAYVTSMVGVVSAGKEKEKGKKRAKAVGLGGLMVLEGVYGQGGAARLKYQTALLVLPTPPSAQTAEDALQAQALRKILTPLSVPHLPSHITHPPVRDSPVTRYPPAPATVGPYTTRFFESSEADASLSTTTIVRRIRTSRFGASVVWGIPSSRPATLAPASPSRAPCPTESVSLTAIRNDVDHKSVLLGRVV